MWLYLLMGVAVVWSFLLTRYLTYHRWRRGGWLALGLVLAVINSILLIWVIWPPLEVLSLVAVGLWVAALVALGYRRVPQEVKVVVVDETGEVISLGGSDHDRASADGGA